MYVGARIAEVPLNKLTCDEPLFTSMSSFKFNFYSMIIAFIVSKMMF
ncbi:LRRCT domain-containing protein [Caenorhabditis elegans]|nr:LRRCT domain-containing protein [Caenorhabditis elegans]CAO78701.1 LRRCT domain-containing protein [Caenorhabditis elegans]|eukprot:NP_001123093.1 eLRR (extracellular Leucine-Rich Repeat) ONly [Caenorhabditis elegans]